MIKQAIIPLAGLGTRLLPLTSVIPKELLPINGKPGLEYILDECIEAGIKDIILIISKKKSIIKDYFYRDNFYKRIIKKKKDKRLLLEYRKIQKYKKKIKFIYQNEPHGTGDAVLKTKNLIKDKLLERQNKYQEKLNKISQRLSNKGFVDSAPKNIVDQEKTNYNHLKNDIQKIQLTIESK